MSMQHLGDFQSARWGSVRVLRGHYDGPKGPTAIVLESDSGEPLATLSVNMYRPDCSRDSADLPADCFYVKTWGGQEALADEALKSGRFVLRADLPVARSGFVSAPVWQIAPPAAGAPQ